MYEPQPRRTLFIGLIGGLLGTLLIASMPAVTAAVGDAVTIGQINKGNATTVLRSSGDPSLRIVNPAGDPALDLRVGQGNRALILDSNKRIPRLNADRVDGLNANQILRTGYGYTGDAADQNGAAVTALITAPTTGYLVMSGSIQVSGNTYDQVECSLTVTQGAVTSQRGFRNVVVHRYSLSHTANVINICATNTVFAVSAGDYEVSLWIADLASADLDAGDVWVIFVPFNDQGFPPDNVEF